MQWTMTVPCDTCPFRKGTAMTLHPDRVRELSALMLDWQGGTFSCHKSVDYDAHTDDDDGDGEHEASHHPGPHEIHCAGALAYALKQNTLPQLARIMERLRGFDGNLILGRSGPLVWDNLRQWLRANARATTDRRRRKPGESSR